MRTLESTKTLLSKYKSAIELIDNKTYVIKGGDMTVIKSATTGRYELSKSDWPCTFNKTSAHMRAKKCADKYKLIKIEVMMYKEWLEIEIKKLQNMIDSTDTPVQETVMENFIHIDCPEVIKTYNIRKLENKTCPVKCNNCLICKYMKDIRFETDSIIVDCEKK